MGNASPNIIAPATGGATHNTSGAEFNVKDKGLGNDLATNARRLCPDTLEGQTSHVWAQDATFLTVNGRAVFRQTRPGDVTRGKTRRSNHATLSTDTTIGLFAVRLVFGHTP